MACSVPSGQFVFSSRPVVKTVRYFRPLVGTSGQLGEYFVRRVRQFMRPSPSWRGEMYLKRFFNLLTRGQCMLCIATSCRALQKIRRTFYNNSATENGVTARAFIFCSDFSARRTRHNGNYVAVSMFLIRNKFI